MGKSSLSTDERNSGFQAGLLGTLLEMIFATPTSSRGSENAGSGSTTEWRTDLRLLALLLLCGTCHAAVYRLKAVDADGREAPSHGFAVSKHMLIATLHGVERAEHVYVLIGKDWKEVKIRARNTYADAVVLKADQDLDVESLDVELPEVGDRISVAGQEGTVEGLSTVKVPEAITTGDSGHPIKRNGKVIGMLRGAVKNDRTVGHFVSANDLKLLMEAAK